MTEHTIKIDAVQWHKPGDHPQVKAAGPTLYKRGMGGYISGMWPFATCWVELEKLPGKPKDVDDSLFTPMGVELTDTKTGETYYRRIWPFNMWKLKGEKLEEPITEDDPFYLDCMAVERAMWHRKEPYAPVPHGWLSPPATGGRVAVFPGDWVVMVADARLIMSDADYRKQYGTPQAAP